MKQTILKLYEKVTHIIGRLTKKYYYEDYVRVYPDQIKYNRFGKKVPANKNDINNYLNHCKFYRFVSQFVKDKRVADVGCGSGYGCEIIKKAGASYVYGMDVSKSSIDFASAHFKNVADFSIASITDIDIIADNSFDVTINSEVMEHIKEYNMENVAMAELKRITVYKGLIIISTPNTELLTNHGFSYEEIDTLFKNNFKRYCIFENALYPSNGVENELWLTRLAKKQTGVIVSEPINLDETVLPKDRQVEVKKGVAPGIFQFYDYPVNTNLLHNTHSWVVLAINDKL